MTSRQQRGILQRAVAWFNGQGISYRRVLSDNDGAYLYKPWREARSIRT